MSHSVGRSTCFFWPEPVMGQIPNPGDQGPCCHWDYRYFAASATTTGLPVVMDRVFWNSVCVGANANARSRKKHTGVGYADTAAQNGVAGDDTLEAHDKYLQPFGLRIQFTGEDGGAVVGVTGSPIDCRVAFIPIGLGGVNGILRVQVVPGRVPILLPVPMLLMLEAVIDLAQLRIHYQAINRSQELLLQPTKHVAVDLLEFSTPFEVPQGIDLAQGKSGRIWFASADTAPVNAAVDAATRQRPGCPGGPQREFRESVACHPGSPGSA